MSASDYLVGLPFLLATYGSTAAAAEIVVRRRLPRFEGATRAVAWAMLATAGLLLACLAPAALTVLSRESVTIAALAILALVAAFVPASSSGGPDGDPSRPQAASTKAERLLAIAGVSGVCLWLAYTAVRYRTHEPVGFDAAGAYLPTAARWLQEGSIWELADWVPNAFYGSGPGHGSLIVLSALLPWENDFLSHLAIYPYVILFAVALYALARELGAPRTTAALLGPMLAAVPVVVQPGLVDGLLDPVMYSSFTAGVLFLVRHHRTAARADLLIAGLALGICFGTKFYGYTSVAAVIALWVAARLLGRVSPATVARQTLAVGGVVLAVGGIWMLRNWIETGNPLMPVPVSVFGLTIFDAPPDPQRPIFGFTLLEYLDQPSVWVDTLAHQFRIAIGLPLIVLAAAVLAAAVTLLRRRRHLSDRSDGIALALLAAVVVLTVVYAATPYTGAGPEGDPLAAAINVRYGLPAAILAVGVAGWLAGRIGPRSRLALGAGALVATIDALRIGPVTAARPVYACFALGAVVAVGAALAGDRKLPGRDSLAKLGRPALVAACAALVIVGVTGGYVLQRAFNDDRYVGQDPALDYVILNSGDGRTVGVAGFYSIKGVLPIYPAFGPRLQNRVEVIGRSVDDALLRRVERRRTFLGKLARLEPDLLIVGRDAPSIYDPDHDRRTPPGAELAWAQSAGYVEVADSERFIVLQRSPA